MDEFFVIMLIRQQWRGENEVKKRLDLKWNIHEWNLNKLQNRPSSVGTAQQEYFGKSLCGS